MTNLYKLIPFALTACGAVANHGLPDASGRDGGPDAVVTGTANVVTNTAVPGFGAVGAAQPMVPVVSLTPDGMLFDKQISDATGHATVKVFPGGSVTAIYQHMLPDMGTDFSSFVGVKPDDTLTFGNVFTPPAGAAVGMMTMTWTAFAGASFYVVITPCVTSPNTAGLSFQFTETKDCHKDPMGITVVAYNSGGTVLGVLTASVPFSLNATHPLGVLPPASATFAYSVGSINPAFNELYTESDVIVNGNTSFSAGNDVNLAAGSGTSNVTPWPTGLVADRVVALTEPGNNNNAYAAQEVLDGVAVATVTETLSPPPVLPLFPTSAALVSPESLMAAWALAGPEPSSATLVAAHWETEISGTYYNSSWYVITPPEMTSLGLPQLPAPYDALEPTLMSQPENGTITNFLIPSITGYDAIRKESEANLVNLFDAVASGTYARVVLDAIFTGRRGG